MRAPAALERLEKLSPRQARIAELRNFGGLSIAETAEALGTGISTVKDERLVSRLWLQEALAVRSRSRERAFAGAQSGAPTANCSVWNCSFSFLKKSARMLPLVPGFAR